MCPYKTVHSFFRRVKYMKLLVYNENSFQQTCRGESLTFFNHKYFYYIIYDKLKIKIDLGEW